MLLFHKLLAKLGYKTRAYKAEMFKAEHPQYVVARTWLYDAMGRTPDYADDTRYRYRMGDIEGDNVFLTKRRGKLYMAVGKIEMMVCVNRYCDRTPHDDSSWLVLDCTFPFRVKIDVVSGGTYRFRFDPDDNSLEIIYERGDEHRIYTFS